MALTGMEHAGKVLTGRIKYRTVETSSDRNQDRPERLRPGAALPAGS